MHLANKRKSDPEDKDTREQRTVRSLPLTGGVDLAAVAESAIRIHQRTIESERVRVIQDLPAGVMTDVPVFSILQVVSNVIAHALSTLPYDGTLSLRLRKSHDRVYLLIAGGGHYIRGESARDVPPRVWADRFAGHGLALSKSIVERHRGTIGVRCSAHPEHAGTTFRISLPASAAGISSEVTGLDAGSPGAPRMERYAVA